MGVLPKVPTIAEPATPVFVYAWSGLLAPRGTPRPVLDELHAEG